MDYRASWQAWAQRHYDDPSVSSAAYQAAIASSARSASQQDAVVAGHRAAVAAGGEYICRPDRAGMAILLCMLLFMLFAPATLVGLSVNPVLGGFAFLAGSVALPVLAVVGLIQVRKNSCFFVNRWQVGRRNWRGKVVASVAREGVASVDVESPGWDSVLLSEEPEEPTVSVSGIGDQTLIPTTGIYWWSVSRIREFAAVAKP